MFLLIDVIRVNGIWKIADFGTATLDKKNEVVEATRNQGTQGYAAPETLAGKYFPATDIYSFGCVLHELITGALPEEGGDERVYKFGPMGPLLEHLVGHLLEKKYEKRINGQDTLVLLNEIIALQNDTWPHA